MRKTVVIRVALAGLLGGAAGAPGRDIPVYREYTQPISFYDEQGERTTFAAVAPDLAMWQAVRGQQAQDAMLGKETPLTFGFISAGAIYRQERALPGKLSVPVSARDNRSGQRNTSGRNWLVKSLSLPSLGQSSSNAAAAAISGNEDQDTGWGWLANDVAQASGDSSQAAILPEDLLNDAEEANPLARQQNALADQANPFRRAEAGTAAGQPGDAETKADSTAGTDGARTDPLSAGTSARETPTQADARQPNPNDFGAADSYRAVAAPELPQTRQLIDQYKTEIRSDFTAIRSSLTPSASGAGEGASLVRSDRAVMDLTAGAAATAGRSDWGWNTPAARGMSPVAGGAAWGGGWNIQGTGEGLWPQVKSPTESVVPVSTPRATPSAISSGGYKPAWY